MTKVPDIQTITLCPSDATPAGKDVSSSATPTSSTPPDSAIKPDIEHVFVEDDPRIWSNARKVGFLFRPSVRTRSINWPEEYDLIHHLRGIDDRRFMCQYPESWVVVYIVESIEGLTN